MTRDIVDVAVAIVQAPDGRVLLAERTARQIAAGFWELPGGRIDPGESAAEAAVRELDEEVGLRARALRPWITYAHAFPTRTVRLAFFRVDRWDGEAVGREGQKLAWVDPAAAHVEPILPSNLRVLAALGLPGQIRLIDPRLAPDQRMAGARRHAGAPGVFLSGAPMEAVRAGVAGLHSTAHQARRLAGRPRTPLWAVSCHSAEDLERATALGADLALVEPPPACGETDCACPPAVGGQWARRADPPPGWASRIPVYARAAMNGGAI